MIVYQVIKRLQLFLLGVICSGCVTNYYDKHYVPVDTKWADSFMTSQPEEVKLRLVTSEEGVLSAIESGYIPLGTSSFVGRHCPWYCAIDKAEKVGADLVLIDEVPKGKEKRTSVVYLSSTRHSYSCGSVQMATGAGGTLHGRYHGSTTTTDVAPVLVEREVYIFDQSAMFLRKGDFKNFYGAFLYQPKRLPDEPMDATVPVTVFAILKGSEAERDGLLKGMTVKSINNVKITTRASFSSFALNPSIIRKIEAVQ